MKTKQNPMREKLKETEQELIRIKKQFKIGFPIFILLIFAMPYILTREFGFINLAKNGNIGSNIGGITAPFVGILSAVLIYLSFKTQIKANKLQLESLASESEKNKHKEDLSFIYYRITELQSLNNEELTKALVNLNDLTTEINRLISDESQFNRIEYINSLCAYFEHKNMFLFRYTILYLVIQKKLEEIIDQIDYIQKEYILSVIKHEYTSSIDHHISILLKTTEVLNNKNITVTDLGLTKFIVLCKDVRDFIKK